MSLPSKVFYCDKCDYQSGSLCMFGHFYYESKTQQIPLNRTLAWCHSCKKLKPCEDFSDRTKVESEIRYYVNELEKYETPIKSILSKFIPSYINHIKYLMEQLGGYTARLDLIEERLGSENCLECGSHDISFFEDKSNLVPELWPGIYKGDQKIGLSHPGCGGNLRVKGSDIRFMLNSRDKPCSLDGTKL